MLIAYQALQFFISKVNIEILEKFDALTIAQYKCYCPLLLIIILYIYIGIKDMNNN